ncbi:MAG: extracellular solute-binding protein, partial [Spirochaetaceae bacterium]|nr:extracellular solute-binding protein [Spirochaetaceae bacterium]
WKSMDLDWREDEDYGFFPFPAVDPGTEDCALGPVDGVVIPRLAKNPEGAKRALRYLAEAVPQEAMSRGSGALAPSAAVPPSFYTGIRRQVREVVAAAPRWAFNYDLAAPPEASAIGLDLFASFLQFPGQYRALLERAEERTKALAGARSP